MIKRRVGVKQKSVLTEEQKERQTLLTQEVEQITELASKLLEAGMTSIYEETIETLRV